MRFVVGLPRWLQCVLPACTSKAGFKGWMGRYAHRGSFHLPVHLDITGYAATAPKLNALIAVKKCLILLH